MAHELYNQLQQAYDFFNQELFSGRLPQCLITVQRENECVHGYFSNNRFGSKHQNMKTIDEIAMNPIYFVNTQIENVLSTLVHEMVHLEQAHFGKPGRGRYHNKEWGDWMERVGLMPSDTGRRRGKRTGDCMTHYIIEGGRFDQACKKLISKQFEITWYDQRIYFTSTFIQKVALEPVNYGDTFSDAMIVDDVSDNNDNNSPLFSPDPEPEGVVQLKKQLKAKLLGSGTDSEADGDSDSDLPVTPLPPIKRNKTAYQCPVCMVKVWGRPNLDIRCNLCDRDFVEQ